MDLLKGNPQLLKIGDLVFILPRYAHLYGSDSGVIVAVIPDPFRSAFNLHR